MGEATVAAKLTAEAVGTFVLIFTIGCNVLGKVAVWAPVSIACSLMVMIYAFGGISGANFNPAVSFALGLSKASGANGMEWKMVGMYSGVQIVSGIVAAIAFRIMYHEPIDLKPNPALGLGPAIMAEFFYTFMLVFVVLNVAVAKKEANHWYGLAIGFVIVAGAYGAGAISGGCFYPAVAIALDVTSLSNIGTCIGYTISELLAALTAVRFFKIVRPQDFNDDAEPGIVAMITSEFLGTFFLVLTVGLNVLANSPAAAYSIAASLMCMIYALGDVSGAHFNPAVTLSIFLSKLDPSLSVRDVVIRMIVQVGAGITASVTYMLMYWATFPLQPGTGYGLGAAFAAEVAFTFVLCLVVLACACSPKTKASQMFGLAIGSCVTVGGFAIGGVSGGSLNPAVSIGIDVGSVVNGLGFGNSLLYSLLELIGGALASGMFFAVRRSEYVKGIYEPIRTYGSA